MKISSMMRVIFRSNTATECLSLMISAVDGQ